MARSWDFSLELSWTWCSSARFPGTLKFSWDPLEIQLLLLQTLLHVPSSFGKASVAPIVPQKATSPCSMPFFLFRHPGHNPDCNLSPHTPKTLLALMVVQLSLSKPRGSGSPAFTCYSTSCGQTHCFHDLVAFLTSPPLLYS